MGITYDVSTPIEEIQSKPLDIEGGVIGLLQAQELIIARLVHDLEIVYDELEVSTQRQFVQDALDYVRTMKEKFGGKI